MLAGINYVVNCLQVYDSSSEDDDYPPETFQQKRAFFQRMGECRPLWEFYLS